MLPQPEDKRPLEQYTDAELDALLTQVRSFTAKGKVSKQRKRVSRVESIQKTAGDAFIEALKMGNKNAIDVAADILKKAASPLAMPGSEKDQ